MLAACHHYADPNSGASPRLRVGAHSAWLPPGSEFDWSTSAFRLYGSPLESPLLLLLVLSVADLWCLLVDRSCRNNAYKQLI